VAVATLDPYPHHRAMPTTTTRPDAWPPERLDRLTRGMFEVVFGRPAPAPAPAAGNVVMLDSRRPAPCPD
jgi:hypothetical protein